MDYHGSSLKFLKFVKKKKKQLQYSTVCEHMSLNPTSLKYDVKFL